MPVSVFPCAPIFSVNGHDEIFMLGYSGIDHNKIPSIHRKEKEKDDDTSP